MTDNETPKGDDRGYPWLKNYTSLLDNPRYMRLTDCAKAIYQELYLLAGRSDAGGLILGGGEIANPDDIAYLLRRDTSLLRAGLSELQAIGLITLESEQVIITRFEEEQGPSQKEKREQWQIRNRRRSNKANGITESEKEKESNKEKEKEKELNKDSDSDSDSEEQCVTPVLHACKDDDELIEYLTKNTLIKVTDSILQEIKDAGLSLADVRAKVEDQRRKGSAGRFKNHISLIDWRIKLTPDEYFKAKVREQQEQEQPDPARVDYYENLPTTGESL